MHLRLDADAQRSEAEKWRKGKTKAEEDLNSLKTYYKKLRLSMRTAGLVSKPQHRNRVEGKLEQVRRNERKDRRVRSVTTELRDSDPVFRGKR
ncbi:hypothetical protein PVK06_023209 [Gossypium arboreum]|uniref:Uncharacterized protein n=1 Tax=Gossypium arboreum TaxID=29729 RepID=A0ABR0PAU1_GOSAR|nr:hypothetical protein PVK06_023209 [Gossypium arboreum]